MSEPEKQPLTRSFVELVRQHATEDAAYAEALRREDVEIAKATLIPVEASFAEWRKDAAYVEAYDDLEGEFSRAKTAAEAHEPHSGGAGVGAVDTRLKSLE